MNEKLLVQTFKNTEIHNKKFILIFRFFVIKDGYLFYYTDQDRKEMDKKKCINIHPKVSLILKIL